MKQHKQHRRPLIVHFAKHEQHSPFFFVDRIDLMSDETCKHQIEYYLFGHLPSMLVMTFGAVTTNTVFNRFASLRFMEADER